MVKATEPTAALVVLETFVIVVDGGPVTYAKGEPIDPTDPILKVWPEKFGPVVYPHPVRRRAIAKPEVRAD